MFSPVFEGASSFFSHFLSFLHSNLAKICKKLKIINVLTRSLSVQHPNTGHNIQQLHLQLLSCGFVCLEQFSNFLTAEYKFDGQLHLWYGHCLGDIHKLLCTWV